MSDQTPPKTSIRTNRITLDKLKNLKKKHFDSQGNKISLNSFIIELMKRYEEISQTQNQGKND